MRKVFVLVGVAAICGCPETTTDGGGSTTGASEVLEDVAQGDDSGGTDGDAGTTGQDEGTPPGDEGTPPGDEGTPPGDDGTPPNDDGTPPELSCETYCADVMNACTGDNSQYPSAEACVAYCSTAAQLPLGEATDTMVNTVGCRAYHAGVALLEDAALHCTHAGPSGGNTCGTWCENLCYLSTANCDGDNAQYDDNAACMTSCEAYSADGAAGDASGDTVQCRIYHLGVAGSDLPSSAGTHCPHGGVDGGDVCVDELPLPTCEDYCEAVTTTCTGDNSQYEDEAACISYCGTWAQIPAGTLGDTAGNTVGCRTYHASVAADSTGDDIGLHCGHAGPTGNDVCGTWCDNYCDLAMTNCSGDDVLYADVAACATACADFPTGGASGDTDGDSVQCKIYHLGVAGSDVDNGSTTTHCPHGAVDGGGVCVDPVPTCADYCAAVTTACTGDNAQYDSEATCLEYCGTWAQLPIGGLDDTAGNTVGCRIYHAGVASTDAASAAIHCGHAGPTGGDVCGTWCENYCDLAQTNCTGDAQLFADADSCNTACGDFPTDGAIGAVDGDSVQCKLYHLGVAGSDIASGSATAHCPHAGVDGGGVCVVPIVDPTCAAYCSAVTAACTGDNQQYTDQAACEAYCTTWAQLPIGTEADTAGNTVGCRTYHAGVASTDGASAAIHCPHAGPTGGTVCGSWCDNYCHLAQTNCSGDNELFADTAACTTACGDYPTDGVIGATAGDSVQCKLYHLGVAGSDVAGGSAGVHCSHGGVDGDGVCTDPLPELDTCANGQVIAAVPFSADGDTGDANNDYWYTAGQCAGETSGWGMGSNDEAYVFTPALAGQYQINLDSSYDSNLYVVTDCADIANSCVAADEDIGSAANESLTLDLTAGTTYYIIVDGWNNNSNASGAYTLSVDLAPPTCATYCAAVTTACTGDNLQYADQAACEAYCATWAQLPAGSQTDTAGNTVGCRTYHAGVASTDAEAAAIHCGHAGPTGGAVCGSWCDNYCHLSQTNCSGDNELFADTAACTTACGDYATDGAIGDTAGASVQCKLYHLGVAGSDGATSAAVHCSHGGVDGDGVCVDPPPEWDTCATGKVIEAVPFSADGDTGDANNDYWYTAGQCPGETSGWGMGSNDEAYVFTPALAGQYQINLDSSYDSNLYVVTDCADIANSCVAADEDIGSAADESLTLDLTAGTTYYIIVDGWNNNGNTSGAYTLSVDLAPPTCATYCAAVTTACTGDNAQYADQAACEAYCATWAQLPAGSQTDTAGNTVGCRTYHAGVASTDAEAATIHCGHAGPTGGNVCGSWCDNYCHLSQTNCAGDNELFADTAACTSACGDYPTTGAIGATDGDSVQCKLYHLGVAGSDGATSAAVHCSHGGVDGDGVCYNPLPELDTCAIGKVIEAVPFSADGNTSDANNDYWYTAGQCPGEASGWGMGSADEAYVFTPTLGGQYQINLNSSYDSNLYVVTDCADIANSCVAADEDVGGGANESLTLDLTAGTTYYIIVDGWNNGGNTSGAYTLSVDLTPPTCATYCAAVTTACTGDNLQYTDQAACEAYCATWAQLPVGSQADTAGNTVGCRTYHAGVASTDAEAAALHCGHAGPTGGAVCGSWCDNYCHLSQTNCTGDNELFADAAACTTACGDYPTTGDIGATSGDSVQCKLYHLGVAGSDGATSAAVHCSHGGVDGDGVCVAPIPDTCETAHVIDSLPFTIAGNTSDANNDYWYSAGQCPPETGGWGMASKDEVYAFTPTVNGEYQIDLKGSGFDSNLYVVTDCANVGTSCVGGDEDAGGNLTESLALDLTAGTTYYIIVDGWNNTSNTSGAYTLSVELTAEEPQGVFHAVTVVGFQFNPPQITIAAGDTVIWSFVDASPHTVTSVDASNNPTNDPLDSPLLSVSDAPGNMYSYTFTEAGVFDYRCLPHAFMMGSVTVE